MSGSLGDLVVSLSADVARFQSDMGKSAKIANDAAEAMATSFKSVENAITGIGETMALLAGGVGFKELIDEGVKWNAQALETSRTMGISTEQASVFSTALDSLGLNQGMVNDAAQKLALVLSKGTDKFDQYGISVKDSSGNLLPMPQIMANVNDALNGMQAGTDRNIMAMDLYGRKWSSIQDIIRLTPEELQKSQEFAERLHLIVGPEGAEKTRQYSIAMNDMKEVITAYGIQIADVLIPELKKFADWFIEEGASCMDGFIKGLHSAEAEIIRLGMMADQFGGEKTKFDALGSSLGNLMGISEKDQPILSTLFGSTEEFARAQAANDQWKKLYDEKDKMLQTLANSEVGLDENGNPIKKSKGATGGNKIDLLEPDDSSQILKMQDATDKAYDAYAKAFDAAQIAYQKQVNSDALDILKANYDTGLLSAQDYYDQREKIQIAANDKELAIAAQRVHDLGMEAAKAWEAYQDPNSEVEDPAKYYEVLAKVEKAKGDLQKLLSDRSKIDTDNTRAETLAQNQLFQQLQTENANIQAAAGDLIGAELTKQAAARSTISYMQLEKAALEGNVVAIQLIKDKGQEWAKAVVDDAGKMMAATLQYANELTKLYDQIATPRAALPDDLNAKKIIEDQIVSLGAYYGEFDLNNPKVKAGLQQEITYWQNLQNAIANNNQEQVTFYTHAIEMQKELNQQLQDEADKTQKTAEAFQSVATAINGVIGMYKELGQVKSEQMAGVNMQNTGPGFSPMAWIGDMSQYYAFLQMALKQGNASSLSGARASGGPVEPNGFYLVGEHGPEILKTGNTGGTIIPNAGAGGITNHGGINVVLPNVTSPTDFSAMARGIYSELKRVQGQHL